MRGGMPREEDWRGEGRRWEGRGWEWKGEGRGKAGGLTAYCIKMFKRMESKKGRCILIDS